MKKLSQCVTHATSLEYVDLSRNKSSPWGVYCALIKHCCVNKLTLCGDEGIQNYVKEVVNSLQNNMTLQSLTLFAYNSKYNKGGCKDMIAKVNCTEKPLNLLNINGKLYFSTLVTHDKGGIIKRVVNVKVLCDFDDATECLPENISLSSKYVNGDTVCLLTFGLYNNITVKKLDLSFNEIKDNEAVIISDCLKYNNTLQVLNLSHNEITDNGAVAISDCLKYNKALKEVNFSYNFMDFRGVVTLSEVIKYVEYVDLSGNKPLQSSDYIYPWSGYCIIIRHCCVNKLTLCGDKGMKNYVKNILDSLQVNATLQSLTLCAFRSYNVIMSRERYEPQSTLVINGKLHFSTLVDGDEEVTTKRVVNVNVKIYDSDGIYKCSTETINLSNNNVSDDRVCLLTFGLYNNLRVKTLNLSFNNLNDDEVAIISDCLRHNSTLQTLDFSHNKITDDAAVVISYCLKRNNTVKELNLSQNKIGFKGINSLSEGIRFVEYVDLSGNMSPPWVGYCIIIRRCSVNKLTLCGDEGMKNYVKEVMDSLQVNATLQSLTLCTSRSSNVVRHEDMLYNRKWSPYTSESSDVGRHEDMLCNRKGSLYTSGSSNVDSHEDMLYCNNRWRSHLVINGKLYLNALVNGAEEVTNKRVVNVKILYDIDDQCLPETIGLSKKDVNDDKVCLLTFGLYNNTTVKKLDLSYNNITDVGVMIISDCLKHNNTLQKLNISQNKITDNGALAISNCLKHNHTLKILNVSQNMITNDGAVAIVDCLKHNNALQKLNVSHCKITDDGTVAITDWLNDKNLVIKLDLSQNHISLKGMNRLAVFMKHSTLLKHLNLSDNKSSPWGVYCTVIRYSCVNSLTLYGDGGMKEHICEITYSLQWNTTLQSLTLRKMGRVGLQLIKDILGYSTTLKELHVSRMSKQTEISIKFNSTKLISNSCEVLDINTLYDGDCVECSSQVINLSNKNINDDAVHLIIFFALDNNATLQKIDLSFNSISDDGTIALSECLMNNCTLKELKLTQNYINQWGMYNLSKPIKNTMPLAYVDLSGNSSSPWSVYCAVIRHCCVNRLTLFGDKGMEECVTDMTDSLRTDMTDSLQSNLVLESLTLCKIGRNGIQLIKSILFDDITLKELNLSWGSNANGTVLMKRQLKPALHNNKEVCINVLCDDYHECLPKTINLSKKNIDDDAAYVIAFGLYQNTTVENLDLSCNRITNDGMLIIKDCLQHNNTLQALNVSHNKITKEGVMIFSDCSIYSKTLEEIITLYPPSKKN